jgi:predicted DNA-binding transcriptional regulator AlpA
VHPNLTTPRPRGARVAAEPPRQDDEAMLSSTQVCARFGGVATMTIWRWMHDPRLLFPRPVKISLRNYWRLGDVREWQAAQAAKATVSTEA